MRILAREAGNILLYIFYDYREQTKGTNTRRSQRDISVFPPR
jgi:hypothetical protein